MQQRLYVRCVPVHHGNIIHFQSAEFHSNRMITQGVGGSPANIVRATLPLSLEKCSEEVAGLNSIGIIIIGLEFGSRFSDFQTY